MARAMRRFGDVAVHALCDGVGPHFRPRAEVLPGVADWAAVDRFDPDAAGPDGTWILHFHCYAIVFDDGGTVLVDAGIGPAGSPAASWAPVPGRLPAELAAAGIAPSDVSTVVLTHLHSDHVGWAGTAHFPEARYVLQRAELATRAAVVEPLRAEGRLHVVHGRTTIRPGLTAVPTPGHTPGHQAVVLDGGLTIAGDALVHAAQLLDPGVAYTFDDDADAARATRVALLREVAGGTLATAHLTAPFHRIG